MKTTNNQQINTELYWNSIYGSEDARKTYAAQSGDDTYTDTHFVRGTGRFNRALDEIVDGDKVLDIGCGVGVFTKLVKNTKPECEVWGVDISSQAIADNTKERGDINYKQGFIGSIDVSKDYFNVVFSGEVLEHLDNPKDLFIDAHKALINKGKFIVTTPHTDRIRSPEHVWEFTHDDVKKLFIENGFSRVRFIFLPDGESELVIMAVGICQK